MKTCVKFAFAAVLFLGGAVVPASATSVFSDQTFAGWTATTVTFGSGGSSSASQQTSGGNPGDYFGVSNSLSGGGGGSSDAYYTRGTDTYTPSIQGAITGINYSVDLKLFSGSVGDAELILKQNGNVYFGIVPEVYTTSGGWSTFSTTGLIATNFARLVLPATDNGVGEALLDLSQNPDFSSSGTLIEFGFGTTFNTKGDPFSGGWGVDNWNVTINPSSTPLPAALPLFATGLGALGLLGWRRKKKATASA